jgi:isoleucyl-tRNA synthetase
MKAARTVVTLGHAVRAAGNLKVRQPLGRVIVVAPPEQKERLLSNAALITDELNVKTMELAPDEAELVTYQLMPNNPRLGPRLGSLFPKVRAALNHRMLTSPLYVIGALRSGKSITLKVDDQTVELAPDDVIITPQPRPGFAVKAEGEYVVALDTTITPELRAEGLAREVVRRVQDLRKSAGFDISDRIVTHYAASEGLTKAIAAHADYIKGETLSERLEAGALPEVAAVADDSFDGEALKLALVKVGAPQPEAKSRTERKPKRKAKPAAKSRTEKKAKPKAAKPKAKAKPAAKSRTERVVKRVKKAVKKSVSVRRKTPARKPAAKARRKTTRR